jgi:hypothetical protein
MNVEGILARLAGMRRIGSGWQALCPLTRIRIRRFRFISETTRFSFTVTRVVRIKL